MQAVIIMLTAIAAVALIHLISALTVDRRIHYKREDVRSNKISSTLDGYTIAFLTDIHNYPLRKLTEIVRTLNEAPPDLVLLGGDFPKNDTLDDCVAVLAGIAARDRFWGVAGNHDNADRLERVMRERNMTLLRNAHADVADGLCVAGIEDLKAGKPNVDKALSGIKQDNFTILLSHNPDAAALYDLSRADLTLSGHTHGGEITLFGLWSPSLYYVSRFGNRYRTGWKKTRSGGDILISNGIGRHLPVRAFAPPQVMLLTLRSE